MHRALEPHVYAGEAGFGLLDVVGDDCLHPMHGRFGVDYVSAIVNHWFDEAHVSEKQPSNLQPKSCSSSRALHHCRRAGAVSGRSSRGC